MEKDILADIFEVEKEIRERLEAERQKGAVWLAEVKRDLEEGVSREDERLQGALTNAVAAARAEAEKKAAALLEEAEARAEQLGRLDDESLMVIIERHIATLLPGRDHDRQNGEG